jgi:myo-inositol-1(or 4)-monophosphatase
MDLKNNLEAAIVAARKAGEFLIKNKNQTKKVLVEQGRDIKIELDRECENLIRDELKSTQIEIYGEEFGGEISQDVIRWIVDPIDGTANYFRGIDQCCISIALMEGMKSKIGVIYNFNTNEIFYASSGNGAFLNEKEIQVSDISDVSKASLFTGFPASESIESQSQFLKNLAVWKKIRMFGSAALSCAYVASGKGDYYAEKGVYLWDFAAGICLIEEAGGKAEFSLIDDDRYSVKFSNGKL